MKKNYILIAFIFLITFKINGQTTLTQTTTNNINQTAVACVRSDTQVTQDNTYYRAFNLNTLGYSALAITGVEFGINSVSDESAGFAVEAVIYGTNSFPGGTLTQLASVSVPIVTADANTLKTAAISHNVMASSYPVVVFAIKIPDEFALGNDTKFRIGGNGDGQTAESYITTTACGISSPITLTAAGSSVHTVMNIVGNPTLGVEDITFNSTKISLTPNPSSEFISFPGLETKKKYTIYNSLGAKIITGVINGNETINIQNLSNGLYFFRFESGKTLKFIKK